MDFPPFFPQILHQSFGELRSCDYGAPVLSLMSSKSGFPESVSILPTGSICVVGGWEKINTKSPNPEILSTKTVEKENTLLYIRM